MDVNAYLKRINYDGPRDVSSDTLRRLHLANLQNVPFENLSIHNSEPIVLDDEALFAKIVARRRGGFCYEANGLFAALLRALGFDVTMLSAEVARGDGQFSPPFDHMALLVKLDERWLADVGFGESFLEPLLLDTTNEQTQGGESFRIVAEDPYRVVLGRKDSQWKQTYRFTLDAHGFGDYEARCRFHQTSPESHFTQNRICSRATPEGRITLSGMRFITTTKHGREERLLATAQEYEEVLRDQFGITMS
jgi:N-hydroxyarylamine O-acetyltransferase